MDSVTGKGEGSAPMRAQKKRVSQGDVPSVPLDEALRVPRAIADKLAKQPSRPMHVAAAMDLSPTSSKFRQICGAAIGYGLTVGGPNAVEISLTELGRRAVSPTAEGEEIAAKRAAVLTPTIEREFLTRYDGNPLPPGEFAKNVLEDLGVPTGTGTRVYEVIRANAEAVGFIKPIKDKEFVDLETKPEGAEVEGGTQPENAVLAVGENAAVHELDSKPATPVVPVSASHGHKVFVSAVDSGQVAEQIKTLLEFGGHEVVLAHEEIPDSSWRAEPLDVIGVMKSCTAGVIFVQSADDGQAILLPTEFMQIGAAIALFGKRFVLLIREDASMLSDLGHIEVIRYGTGGLTLSDVTQVAASLSHETDEG